MQNVSLLERTVAGLGLSQGQNALQLHRCSTCRRCPITFKQYLEGRTPSNDALGAFTRMAITDVAMPDATKWITLRYYLEDRAMAQEEIEAAKVLWGSYQAWAVVIGADRG